MRPVDDIAGFASSGRFYHVDDRVFRTTWRYAIRHVTPIERRRIVAERAMRSLAASFMGSTSRVSARSIPARVYSLATSSVASGFIYEITSARQPAPEEVAARPAVCALVRNLAALAPPGVRRDAEQFASRLGAAR